MTADIVTLALTTALLAYTVAQLWGRAPHQPETMRDLTREARRIHWLLTALVLGALCHGLAHVHQTPLSQNVLRLLALDSLGITWLLWYRHVYAGSTPRE
jgi:hypothetical protein